MFPRPKNISLGNYGYSLKNNSNNTRQNALRKALAIYNQNNVYNKVKFLGIVHSRKNPVYANRAKKNVKWMNTFKVPKNFFVNVNAKGRKIHTGPKGGRYVLEGSRKIYIK